MEQADERTLPQAHSRNLRAVLNSLERAAAQRSLTERFVDGVAGWFSRPVALLAHGFIFGLWVFWNCHPLFGYRPFDPFPFSLLSLAVSLEAIMLTLFVLASQARIRVQADRHAHADLQVNLLAELETTKLLGLVQALCDHFGIAEAKDEEIGDLRVRVDPERLFEDLETKLPGSPKG